MSAKPRSGQFAKVKDNLYRYSATKTSYAVFRRQGKLRWKSLKTTDRELAERRLRGELDKAGHVDVRQEKMTLEALLTMFEEGIKKYDFRTQRNRRSIIRAFRRTWANGFETLVKDISPAQVEVWLSTSVLYRACDRTKWTSLGPISGHQYPMAVYNRRESIPWPSLLYGVDLAGGEMESKRAWIEPVRRAARFERRTIATLGYALPAITRCEYHGVRIGVGAHLV